MSELTGDAYSPHGEIPVPRRRAPLAAATGALAALAVAWAAGSWVWGLGARDPAEIPFLRAEPGALRETPEDPGGLTLGPAERAVTRMLTGAEGDALRLAPPPEAPADEDMPVARAPAAPPSAEISAAVDQLVAEALAEAGELLPMPQEDAPPPAAVPVDPDAHAPVAAPPAPPRPAQLTAAAATPAPPRTGTPESFAAGAQTVQLGAFNTRAIAEAEWRRFLARHADLLGALSPAVIPVQSGGRTLWRLRAGPLPDTARASALCADLKARGLACIPARMD